MAYIGNIPAESYASFETETFSVSATANYTLSHAVTNENEIRLVINGVVQQPGSGKAYTASGTTLTLTSATVSGDVMYAVYLGRALQTVNPPNASVGSAQVADSLISGKTALGATPADTDELLISDAGTLKRVDYSYLKSSNTPAFFALKTSDQTISDASGVKVTFDSEVYDVGSGFDLSNNKFVVPSNEDGKYILYGGCQMEANGASELDNSIVYIYKNGSIVSQYENNPTSNPGRAVNCTWSDSFDLSAADYIEMYAYIDDTSGSPTVIGNARHRTFIGGYKLIGV